MPSLPLVASIVSVTNLEYLAAAVDDDFFGVTAEEAALLLGVLSAFDVCVDAVCEEACDAVEETDEEIWLCADVADDEAF